MTRQKTKSRKKTEEGRKIKAKRDRSLRSRKGKYTKKYTKKNGSQENPKKSSDANPTFSKESNHRNQSGYVFGWFSIFLRSLLLISIFWWLLVWLT